jgi:hypothetical protein
MTALIKHLTSRNNKARTLSVGKERKLKSQPNRPTKTLATEQSKPTEISLNGANDFTNLFMNGLLIT